MEDPNTQTSENSNNMSSNDLRSRMKDVSKKNFNMFCPVLNSTILVSFEEKAYKVKFRVLVRTVCVSGSTVMW